MLKSKLWHQNTTQGLQKCKHYWASLTTLPKKLKHNFHSVRLFFLQFHNCQDAFEQPLFILKYVLGIYIMVATENLLRFGWTRCPASVIVMPWTMTWSMTVALISSVMKMRCLACPPSPLPPRPAPLPPLTQTPLSPLTRTPLLLSWSSILVFEPSANCTDLYKCGHIICNRCFQLWVVVFTDWHQVCSLCSSFADCG